MIALDSLCLCQFTYITISIVHLYSLPGHVVIVLMVDQCGNTAVWVEPHELRILLLPSCKVEVDRLIGETEFLKDDSNFPIERVTI